MANTAAPWMLTLSTNSNATAAHALSTAIVSAVGWSPLPSARPRMSVGTMQSRDRTLLNSVVSLIDPN